MTVPIVTLDPEYVFQMYWRWFEARVRALPHNLITASPGFPFLCIRLVEIS
jgi:hypothetical protein